MILKYLNILSNLIYPVVGYFGDWITLTGGIILCLGSGWMHYEEEINGTYNRTSVLADWIGIYAFTFAVIAYLTNPWVLLLMVPILLLGHQIRDPLLIGILVLTFLAITVNWQAFICFGSAAVLREIGDDKEYENLTHSVWHLLSGAGYLMLITY